MKNISIQHTSTPDAKFVDMLTDHINESYKKYGQAKAFGFIAKDEDGKVIAGCNGFLLYGTAYIDQLWVDGSSRKQGIASQIIERVHGFAKEQNCSQVTINTFTFMPDALALYLKLGYKIDFEREGYVQASKMIFMSYKL